MAVGGRKQIVQHLERSFHRADLQPETPRPQNSTLPSKSNYGRELYLCTWWRWSLSQKNTQQNFHKSWGFCFWCFFRDASAPISQSINPRSRRIWWHYCFPLELVARRSIDLLTLPGSRDLVFCLNGARTHKNHTRIYGTKSPNEH